VATITTSTSPVDYLRTDALLTPEERAVRDRVRAFVDAEVIPVAQDYWERAQMPFELIPRLAALNICGGTIRGYGCPGLSSIGYGLALQELARGDGSLATFLGVQSSLAMNAIYYCGTEEQRQRYLPPMARLELLGAFGLTEPQHGSDAAGLETSARQEGDTFVLNGRKRWIGNASICDIAIIWARLENGKIAGFIVPRETPGYSAHVIEHKLSKRAIWQADVALDEVRVPAENLLSGMVGFGGAATVLTHSRLFVAWGALGQAMACYEIALAYAKERVQFGRPIASFQLVQSKLVNMLNEITKAQLLVLQLSRLRDAGTITTAQVSLAKMNNAEMARHVALDAREILGGNGILGEYHVMRHLCDLEAGYTYEGTHDINALIVGRDITGINAIM
jgi:glutaryl-CoA dehydrogenase